MFGGEWLEVESKGIHTFYHDCQDLHHCAVSLSGKLQDILLFLRRYVNIKTVVSPLVGIYWILQSTNTLLRLWSVTCFHALPGFLLFLFLLT